jgi:hypothetical protein
VKDDRTVAIRCDSIEHLSDREFLSEVVGPVAAVERQSMGTPGFSGSTHVRLEIALQGGSHASVVLKQTDLARNWTAYRTADRLGREAMLLATSELAHVWQVFACPYLAFAIEPGSIGLLMQDLTPHLLPDVREPIDVASEDALLSHLARLHARFWESEALGFPWLAKAGPAISVIGPVVLDRDPLPPLPSPLRERTAEGWAEAFRRLSAAEAAPLRRSIEELQRLCDRLPQTLVHGDVKVANFAFLSGGAVAAFDWAMVGCGPVSLDLGWYLAVNASRLARSKEEVLARYRELLGQALGSRIEDPLWQEIGAAAVLAGSLMLLWSKALALRDGRAGAREEWDWWVERLSAARS